MRMTRTRRPPSTLSVRRFEEDEYLSTELIICYLTAPNRPIGQ